MLTHCMQRRHRAVNRFFVLPRCALQQSTAAGYRERLAHKRAQVDIRLQANDSGVASFLLQYHGSPGVTAAVTPQERRPLWVLRLTL